jgi:hypothetical protein
MREQIAVMLDHLFDTAGEDVTYTSSGGGDSAVLKALVGSRDDVSEMGHADIAHDVLRFQFRKSDFAAQGLSDPKRGATIAYEGGTFTFSNPPRQDDLGILWLFDAYRG